MGGCLWLSVRALVKGRRRTILAAFFLLHQPVGSATGEVAFDCSKFNPPANALGGLVNSPDYKFIYNSYFDRNPPNDNFVTIDVLIENKSLDRVLQFRGPT